jgi:dTMP kinase
MSARGRFITLEGIDGAGKSTHLQAVASRVRAAGHEVVVTREPGGTPLGEELRRLVLVRPMDARTEALVMFAARREHVVQVIEPALAAGRWVVSDRFSDATFAYQCGGRGLEREVFAALEALVHPGLEPDATFLFDIDPEIAHARQRAQSRDLDKFEREQSQFFERVRAAYLERARLAPGRIHVIDASLAPEAVAAALDAAWGKAFR